MLEVDTARRSVPLFTPSGKADAVSFLFSGIIKGYSATTALRNQRLRK
jgi:hypothetical protein